MSLSALKDQILADGVIDKDEVTTIRGIIFADGKVDQEEMDFLFELNEKATTKCPEFASLVCEAGKAYCLEDDTTPGVVDHSEASYLVNAIMNDGKVDDVERALLVGIKESATSIDPLLTSKMDELGI